MKTLSKLFLVVSFLTFGCATGQTLQSAASPNRGAVALHGPAVKALGAGPGTIHAYSAYAGGALYAVPAVSGTDSDCHRQGVTPPRLALQADRIVEFDVASGQIACLASSRAGSFELLWHTTDRPGALLARE